MFFNNVHIDYEATQFGNYVEKVIYTLSSVTLLWIKVKSSTRPNKTCSLSSYCFIQPYFVFPIIRFKLFKCLYNVINKIFDIIVLNRT